MAKSKLKYFEKHLPLKKLHSHRKIQRKKTQKSQVSEEPQKLKESTSSITDQCYVFNDAFDNPDCRGIPMNCLKNLKTEIKTKFKI